MFVNTLGKMQQDLRFLTAAEREQLALSKWNSLGDGSDHAVSQQLDPGGIELALQRDGELESGETCAITSEEFLQRTRRGRGSWSSIHRLRLLYAEVRGIRRALLVRFPFLVLYRVREPKVIRVLALRHHKRKNLLAAGRK